MKINRLEIDAFMAVGEVTIDLDSKGLVLIQGENEDDSSQISNGAGKSSIADALLWCLYNETARGDTGDEIVNRSLKKGTRVLAQLVDGDRVYNVIRHRKHGVHKNRVLLLDVTNKAIGSINGFNSLLVGDATKARRELGFSPSLDIKALARTMVEADLARERGA